MDIPHNENDQVVIAQTKEDQWVHEKKTDLRISDIAIVNKYVQDKIILAKSRPMKNISRN